MNISGKLISGTIVLGTIIYFLSPGPKHFLENSTPWEFREQFVYLTGVCAISLMVLAMTLSLRIQYIDRLTRGLDKTYIVHKWTGIITTIFVLLHWLSEYVPHWLVLLNLIHNPGELTDGTEFSVVEIFLFQSGVTIAEFLFYVFLSLIAVAFIKSIPYSFFRKTHKFFPVVFLLFAYHAGTAQLKEHWIGSIGSYLLFFLLLIGCITSIVALFMLIGKSRKAKAIIKHIGYYQNDVCDLGVEIVNNPFKYKAGQYAFLQFEHSQEPHPFTIASSENNSNSLRFGIKHLGDFTKELIENIQIGQEVEIEGAYGEFNFEDDCERQIWIAGGIGITPFIAKLDELLQHNATTNKQIDFWYCTRGKLEYQFPSSLQNLCNKCGVHFYHLNSKNNEYLTVDLIKMVVPNFDNASIWFCGQETFRKSIQKQLMPYRFDKRKFHFDSFNMR